MFCLSFLIPGKIGRVIRRILFPIIAIVIVYMIVWTIILKCIKFNVTDQKVGKNFLYLTFQVRNTSFATVELCNMDVFAKNGKAVKKRTRDLPAVIPRYSGQKIRVGFALDEYKSIDVTVKALYRKFTIKTKL